MRLVLLLAAIATISLSSLALAATVHWDYHSHGGAEGWGELVDAATGQPAYPDCDLRSQSPVNIENVAPRSGGLSVKYLESPLAVLNNGHTIQVAYAPGSSLTFGGKTYTLLQFHFHAPSEHEMNVNRSPLEMHLVHQAPDGEFAVLGVMIVEGSGNAAFQKVLDLMPRQEGTSSTSGTVDALELLPDSFAHYAYDGSFTTPPCTEGVKWKVLHQPIEASASQIATFRSLEFLHHDDEFIGNARPVQPLNGRLGDTTVPVPARVTPPNTGDGGLKYVTKAR